MKRRVRQLVRRWHSRRYAFSPADLTRALVSLGIGTGDIVLAHCAYNQFIGFSGRPSDVLDSLRAAVGPSGTLLMPSMPFDGSALAYVRSGQMFDVRRTPSRMGLVTELFRRSAGTLRSLHPTHPVLASGARAAELLVDHPRAATPCGEHSPFAKLSDGLGKIALLGAGIEALTFYHYLEERLEGRLPQSPFTRETFTVPFRGYDGGSMQVETRLFDPVLSGRRRLGALKDELRRRGEWREARLGRMAIVVLEAGAVTDAAHAMAERGSYCYV